MHLFLLRFLFSVHTSGNTSECNCCASIIVLLCTLTFFLTRRKIAFELQKNPQKKHCQWTLPMEQLTFPSKGIWRKTFRSEIFRKQAYVFWSITPALPTNQEYLTQKIENTPHRWPPSACMQLPEATGYTIDDLVEPAVFSWVTLWH